MDLNHFYSGLNALALVSVTLELIAKDPEEWKEPFETDSDADATRQRLERERGELADAGGLSLGAAPPRLGNGERDSWLDLSASDHEFLASKRPGRAAAAYKQAV